MEFYPISGSMQLWLQPYSFVRRILGLSGNFHGLVIMLLKILGIAKILILES